MRYRFFNKHVTGILSVLPQNVIRFEDEIGNYSFSEKQSLKLGKVMGYGTRRVVEGGTTVSDLCVYGLNYLFNQKALRRDSIDALILVTQSPDYFLPATSNVIAGKIGLGEDVLCLDINQGCAGFEIGLLQAYLLLGMEGIDKVVLLNADTLSKKVSVQDRNSRPLIGDGATVTVVENSEEASEVNVFVKMDSSGAEALKIPAGGFKLPPSPETATLMEDEAGNFRSLNDLVMKGDAVFNFVLNRVPEMMAEMFAELGTTKDTYDYYLFHQPNRFMLKKLAEKVDIPYGKMPNNICEKYGNGSGITVPLNICENLGEEITSGRKYKVCLGGFGVGLSWSLIDTEIGNFSFCDIIDY